MPSPGVCRPAHLPTLYAQTTTGQITGRISDPTDAVVVGAQLKVTNMDTGVGRETLSSSSGYYTVPLLEPGRYQVNVQMPGFQPVAKSNITLQVEQVARVDFGLEVGSSQQTVMVESSAPILDAATSSLGQVVENRQITELPINDATLWASWRSRRAFACRAAPGSTSIPSPSTDAEISRPTAASPTPTKSMSMALR